MVIASFDIAGAKIIPPGALNGITASYAGKCLTLEQINALLAEIGNWYLDLGYVTTRAYLPPQDLTSGVLRIVVVEGRAEELRFRPDQPVRRRLVTAFPRVKDEVLNIRDLEQGLDQLNRLPSNDAKLKLEPGTQIGGTTVIIENASAKPYRFSYTEDNSGSKSTGVRQRTLGVEIDDPLGLNDAWTLQFKPNASGSEDFGSRTLSGSASVPYGYWTLGYSESWFRYVSTIQATTQSYRSTGISRQRKAALERVVFRGQDSKASLEGALIHKETRNFIADTLLETQSRKLSIAGLTLRHSTRLGGGTFNASAGYEQGLRILGAKKDHQIAANDPRAQFHKWSADVSYARPFQAGERNFNASTSVSGQWSPHTLFGSERVSVGGLSSVRGFKEENASGDVGGYLRNELSWYAPKSGVGTLDKAFGQIAPYAAIDAGWIKSDPAEDREGGTLSGWAVGLRTLGGIVTLDITWAEPISMPGFIHREAHEVYASVGVEF